MGFKETAGEKTIEVRGVGGEEVGINVVGDVGRRGRVSGDFDAEGGRGQDAEICEQGMKGGGEGG